MSQDQATYDAEIVAIEQIQMRIGFVTSAMSALVFYEYLLTIGAEYKIVWRQKWTGMTWILVTTRYLMVTTAALNLLGASPSECMASSWGMKATSVLLPLLLAAAFSALRVYAISGRILWITTLVFALNLVPAVINSWGLSRDKFGYVNDPVFGPSCTGDQSVSPSMFYHLSLVSRVTLILADAIVIAVTWIKTFSQMRLASQAGIVSLSTALVRDGSIYFLALLGMNVWIVVLNSNPSLAFGNIAAVVFVSLPSILICRFLMNLREASSPPTETTLERFSRFSLPNFRVPTMDDIVGNLGEDLDYGPQADHAAQTDALDELDE